jgi:hypothetical protein
VEIRLTHQLARNRVPAGSTVPFAASFYNDAGTLTAPTTARYRVYDTESGCELIAWTTISPATTASISLPGTSLESECDRRVALQCEANTDLATQAQAVKRFIVEGLRAQ